jgi:hypothetical protein
VSIKHISGRTGIDQYRPPSQKDGGFIGQGRNIDISDIPVKIFGKFVDFF